jgi:hypothetical protein
MTFFDYLNLHPFLGFLFVVVASIMFRAVLGTALQGRNKCKECAEEIEDCKHCGKMAASDG